MKRLFGTDGIRGAAGEPPLDRPTVRRFGMALAETLTHADGHPPRVALGRDTRESGPWIRDAIAGGLLASGAVATDAGVVTTPALAHATRHGGFDAGVMISASHNPFEDNGIKVFSRTGTKLPDTLEREIEERILDGHLPDLVDGDRTPATDDSLLVRYLDALGRLAPNRRQIGGRKLLIDCSNGSAVSAAPGLFRDAGATFDVLGVDPDGRNINLGCGSTHMDPLRARVVEGGYDLGIAFDGDADRCLAVDARGNLVDGDHILYLGARHLDRHGRLPGRKVVATIMSNFWLERRLSEEGIALLRAPVGDKYVLERMTEEGAALGGEQSGHVIFREHATTGDGLLTALMLLHAIAEEDRSLEQILADIVPSPQVLLNVRVVTKPDLRAHPTIGPAVTEAERRLHGTGRVVLRYSGTEPLARVMIEGDDAMLVRSEADVLAALIRREIGEHPGSAPK